MQGLTGPNFEDFFKLWQSFRKFVPQQFEVQKLGPVNIQAQ